MTHDVTARAQRQGSQGGFTLIEVLVVVVIIGILATLAVPYMNQARVKARETQIASNLQSIHTALESFATDNNGMYPYRIRWFDENYANDPRFDPRAGTDEATGLTSDPNGTSLPFSLGLIGGVNLVHPDWQVNVDENVSAYVNNMQTMSGGPKEHVIHQPYGYDDYFYEQFNQHSDPLVALGYLPGYPSNPFMRHRPMGAITYGYGVREWNSNITYRDENGNPLPPGFDMNIPYEGTMTTPGDFVYTHFYTTSASGGVGSEVDIINEPTGIIEVAKSYAVQSPDSSVGRHPGIYYLDMVDSYQLWVYGSLNLNGGFYITYPNNALNLVVKKGGEAKNDYNNNGVKDMFEMGLISYYKQTASGSTAARRTSDGAKVEF